MEIYIALITLLVSQIAYSWGPEGHETVALVAQQILQAQSQKNDPVATRTLSAINSILGQTQIADAATWPDVVKQQSRDCDKDPFTPLPDYVNSKGEKGVSSPICDAYQATAEWHFSTINPDLGQTVYNLPSKVASPNKKPSPYAVGDLVIIIKGLSHVLRNEAAPILAGVDSYTNWKDQCKLRHSCKKEALEFLIHFLGDIHQPLHSGASCDVGGNSQYINFFGVTTDPSTVKAPWCKGKPLACANYELHAVWDTTLLVYDPVKKGPGQFDANNYAAQLVKTLANKKAALSSDNKQCVSADSGSSLSEDNLDENNGPNNGPIGWVNESACYFKQVYTFPDDPQPIAKKGGKLKRSVAQAANPIPNLCSESKKSGQGFNQKFSAFNVGQKYYDIDMVTINERLYWGGARLANVLRYIYGGGDKVQGELQ